VASEHLTDAELALRPSRDAHITKPSRTHDAAPRPQMVVTHGQWADRGQMGHNAQAARMNPMEFAQTQARCDHKFVDSKACLKCGWAPSPVPPAWVCSGSVFGRNSCGQRNSGYATECGRCGEGRHAKPQLTPCTNCCGAGYFGQDSKCRVCDGTGSALGPPPSQAEKLPENPDEE
jgi:hypothetical protein